ncbi:MAG: hypothetical protein Q9226_004417 [Calogaya cf. arnoldii]
MLFQAILSFAAVALAAPSTSDLKRRAVVPQKVSFTQYEGCGSTVACGPGATTGGPSAAVSQNLFGVGDGEGAGSACGTCWAISSDQPGTKSITVTVNNLCPAIAQNPVCQQNAQNPVNRHGANVHFDLCMAGGAASAFFGNGPKEATGSAKKISNSPC